MPAEEEYEHIPNSSMALNMLAGAIAGITEHTVTYPLDALKTRMQFITTTSIDISAITSTFSFKNIPNIWRGFNSVLLGAGPAHALYFGSYEACKNRFRAIDHSSNQHFAHACSGAIATFAHDGFMTPFDVVKQRMQISSQYRNIFDCTRTIYQHEGFTAFYISYPVTLMMSIPFQVIQFTTYEFIRKKMNPNDGYNPLSHCVAGGVAGGLAALITNPLDVAKTLIQTRGLSADSTFRKASGLFASFKLIYEKQGLSGFGRGIQARVLSFVPSTAVAWTTYEFMKMIFSSTKA